MHQLSLDRYHAALIVETERIAAVVRAADPNLPIPTCPEWTMTRLAEHVGRGHRWAAVIVERRATAPVPNAEADDTALPDGVEARSRWLVVGADRLAAAVRDCGPGTPVWTWTADGTAGFWLRKLCHDTVIHRVDAEMAVGRASQIAPDLAADGVSDLLTSIATLSAVDSWDPTFAGLRGTGETLQFRAIPDGASSAGAGQWLARRTPDGVTWKHGLGDADVEVRGTVTDLLMVLNRRATPDTVEVVGDEKLLAHWLRHSAF
jgi:uncharacterized protein (TIGR03083 family)